MTTFEKISLYVVAITLVIIMAHAPDIVEDWLRSIPRCASFSGGCGSPQ